MNHLIFPLARRALQLVEIGSLELTGTLGYEWIGVGVERHRETIVGTSVPLTLSGFVRAFHLSRHRA